MKSSNQTNRRQGLSASVATGILALALAFTLGVNQPTVAVADGPSAEHRPSAFIDANNRPTGRFLKQPVRFQQAKR